MQCTKCQKLIPDNTRYCPICGAYNPNTVKKIIDRRTFLVLCTGAIVATGFGSGALRFEPSALSGTRPPDNTPQPEAPTASAPSKSTVDTTASVSGPTATQGRPLPSPSAASAPLAAEAPKATATTAPVAPTASPTTAKPTSTATAVSPSPTATSEPQKADAAASNLTGELEIFSWWTSGGEVEALGALYDIFKKQSPKVEIVNSALTGGTSSGGNIKAVLQTRMMGGDPPESFQIHIGEELNTNYVVAGHIESLDAFYKDEGLDQAFPKKLLDMTNYQGKPWAVPVNIHRTNVMWYSKRLLASVNSEPPKTWDQWFTVADKLKARGISALAVSEIYPGQVAQLYESILMGRDFFGPAGYRRLFTGASSWSDPKIRSGLELLLKMEPYFNRNYLNTQWSDMIDLMVTGKAAMIINGDWTPGVLWSKKFTDFGWAACPGDEGVYSITPDAFVLPKDVKKADNARAWLRVCGSKEGQEAFNLLKGSIPVRTDCDISKYTDYHKSAYREWADPKTEITPSIVHGVAAKPSFNVDFMVALNDFIIKKDVAATQAALVKAAKDAGFKA